MPRQEKRLAKKRGRPATGRGVTVGVRCHNDLLKAIDGWRQREPDLPTRATAIRRLTELGLASALPQQKTSKKAAAKAHEMASQEIDRLGDASLTTEEHERRKRRLTKGPGEFRDMRGDILPKPKR
jgi:hypothetical protein